MEAIPESKDKELLIDRYLLPFEDAINELAVVWIRRILVKHHIQILVDSFGLVVLAMLTMAIGSLLPDRLAISVLVINISVGILAFAPVQLLLTLSYLRQEASEESIESEDSGNDEESVSDT